MTFYKQSSEKKTIILDIFIFIKLIYFFRWYSSRNTTELTSFDEYISRAKTG